MEAEKAKQTRYALHGDLSLPFGTLAYHTPRQSNARRQR